MLVGNGVGTRCKAMMCLRIRQRESRGSLQFHYAISVSAKSDLTSGPGAMAGVPGAAGIVTGDWPDSLLGVGDSASAA